MSNSIMHKSRNILGVVKSHRIAADLAAREKMAFETLHPQVEVVKRSPSVQIATASAISGLLFTGNFGTAVAVTSAWLSSKPLTHLAAGCVAGVGAVDAVLADAFGRLEAMQAEPAADEKSARAKRRRAKAHVARVGVGG